MFSQIWEAWPKRQPLPDDEMMAIDRHLRQLDRLDEDFELLDHDVAKNALLDRVVKRLKLAAPAKNSPKWRSLPTFGGPRTGPALAIVELVDLGSSRPHADQLAGSAKRAQKPGECLIERMRASNVVSWPPSSPRAVPPTPMFDHGAISKSAIS